MMRSKYFLACGLTGVALLALAGGCSSSDDTDTQPGGAAPGGGGPGGSGGGTTTTTTTTTTSNTTTSSTTTVTSDGNDTFATASDMALEEVVQAELNPVATDVDFYQFTGTANQAIFVLTDSKPDDDPYADGYPDLVVTLYDADQNQIAQNDDPFPRNTQDSALITRLPADGTYYLKVEEFCESELAQGNCPADYFDGITETGYAVMVTEITWDDEGNVAEPSPDDNATLATLNNATPMEYGVTTTAGAYYLTLTHGTFASATDSDFYVVNLPDDLALEGGTPVIQASPYPSGIGGDGASIAVGRMTLWNATGTVKIAEIDAALGGELSPPVTDALTTNYILEITNPGGTLGATPFYFLNHNGTAFLNEDETEGTPLALTVQDNGDGSISYFSQGHLTPAATDSDDFTFDVPAGMLTSIACGAQRSGSGVRGLTADVVNSGGTTVDSGTETATTDLFLEDITLNTGTYTLRLSADSQDAQVTSDFYRCGIHVRPSA